MKYIFTPTGHPFADWYERTDATPNTYNVYTFYLRDLRVWFRKWVFK